MRVLSLLMALALVAVVKGRRGYLITAPKVLQSGAEERACVTFHDLDQDIQVTFTLVDSKNVTTEYWSHSYTFHRGQGRCVGIHVPNLPLRELMLTVEGRASAPGQDGQLYTFAANKTISVRQQNLVTFIQTDKPMYKPGQTVKFRVLTLQENLRPRTGNISQVWMLDASGTRLQQWVDVQLEDGLASLEMGLSKEPVLGTWSINAMIDNQKETQAFKVEEYVLPKFEVTIKPPAFVMVDAETVEGQVCAKYTYGKPVRGTFRGQVCIKQQYRGNTRPCVHIASDINGCAPFSIPASELMLNSMSYSLWNAKLHVTAEVTETATGITLNGSDSSAKVERDPLKLDINSHSPDSFKPGLRYHGKVVVTFPNGAPAPNEQIEITARNYQNAHRFSRNFTSDQAGIVHFGLPTQDVATFYINVRAPAHMSQYEENIYRPYEPRASLTVKKWYSPSGSFLQIDPIRGTNLCGPTMSVNVTYTTEANTNFLFYYKVMSKGNIVHSGHKHHHFRRHDFEEPADPVLEEEPTLAPPTGPPQNHDRRMAPEDNSTTGTISPPGTLRPPFPTPPHIPPPPVLPHKSHMFVEFAVTADMSPQGHILIYYIREDGETVADSAEFDVEKCFANQVDLQFDAPQRYPGEKMSLRVRGAAGSLCGVSVVDKSVHLLGGNNQLTVSKVFAKFADMDQGGNSGHDDEDEYCTRWMREHYPDWDPERWWEQGPWNRRKRSIWMPRPTSKYYDAIQAFKRMGVVALSDLNMRTSPCEAPQSDLVMYAVPEMAFEPPMPAPAGGVMNGPAVESLPVERLPVARKTVEIRNYFPETWLWDLVRVGRSGEEVVRRTVPHTITEWVGSGFCSHPEAGLGVTGTVRLRAFQPFFVSFTLPYSVIRGEKVPVLLTAFNYLTDCLTIELTLKNLREFRLVDTSNKARICVCGGQSATHQFTIVPRQLGKINITVRAVSVDDSSAMCGNGVTMSSEVGARDAVTRPLLVEAEGAEKEYTYSSFICPRDNISETVPLELPADLVADSARAFVSVIGDIMGPTLQNLDSLVRMPTGCGEQNMLGFAPNIFVMQYLSGVNQATTDIVSKATEYMKTGYQRELNYRHDDGSYSAFGKNDESGSMWLTAYVVKSFAQARPFIFVDNADLVKSIAWFQTKQLENGCFPQVGRVLHKSMKGGLANGGSDATLSTFVLISMLEAGMPRSSRSVQEALNCLAVQTVEDTYTIALMAYAYALYEPTHELTQQQLARLEALAVTQNGMTHWERSASAATPAPTTSTGWQSHYEQAPAAEVEMTAYALMALVTASGEAALVQALPIVRWISKQRNAQGGFTSTQDTIVALQALASYATLAYRDGINMNVNVQASGLNKRYTINDDNSLLLQRDTFAVPNSLRFTATGTGCALLQANVRYNIRNFTSSRPAFSLMTSVVRVRTGPGLCKKRNIHICTTYTGPDDASNMAVIEVKMVSGWIPDKDSLKQLMSQELLDLKRFEVDKNYVHLYFNEIGKRRKCFSLAVVQNIDIRDTKPALVHVYDYYETDDFAKSMYNIRRTCGTKEELPHLTPEEYERLEEQGPFVQRRQPPFPFPGRDARIGGEDDLILEPLPMREIPPAPLVPCPSCFQEKPENFHELFCASEVAYKATARRDNQYPLKLLTELRSSRKKKKADLNLSYSIHPDCLCPVLSNATTNGKILVLSQRSKVVVNTGSRRKVATMILDEVSSFMPIDRNLQRDIARIHRRKGCRTA